MLFLSGHVSRAWHAVIRERAHRSDARHTNVQEALPVLLLTVLPTLQHRAPGQETTSVPFGACPLPCLYVRIFEKVKRVCGMQSGQKLHRMKIVSVDIIYDLPRVNVRGMHACFCAHLTLSSAPLLIMGSAKPQNVRNNYAHARLAGALYATEQ